MLHWIILEDETFGISTPPHLFYLSLCLEKYWDYFYQWRRDDIQYLLIPWKSEHISCVHTHIWWGILSDSSMQRFLYSIWTLLGDERIFYIGCVTLPFPSISECISLLKNIGCMETTAIVMFNLNSLFIFGLCLSGLGILCVLCVEDIFSPIGTQSIIGVVW